MDEELEPKTGEQKPVLARTWVRVAMASAAAILLLVFFARDRGSKTEGNLQSHAPVAPSQPATTRDVPPPASSTEPGRVEIVVRASPAAAQITIDDKPVENPFVAAYPKDGTMHRIAAHAWGYEPKSESVLFTADTIVNLGLNLRASPANSPVAPASGLTKRAGSPLVGEGVASRPSAASSGHELDPSGGRTPLRPIETKDPYGAP